MPLEHAEGGEAGEIWRNLEGSESWVGWSGVCKGVGLDGAEDGGT